MAPPHTARMQSASITIPRDDHQQFCNLFPIFLVLISGMFWCEICVMTCCLWNRRCKFPRQFAIWLLFLEIFDGGALYLGGTAECNLGVGHFHEVAAWSPYHLSQKASQT